MHSAPAVTVTGDDGGRWRRAVHLSCLGVAAVALAWTALALHHGQAGLATLLYAAATLAGTTLAWRSVAAPPASLHWDGAQWWWAASTARPQPEQMAGQIQVSVDAGRWLLLRFTATSARRSPWRLRPTRWLAVAAAEQPGAWHALRCAVYSSQRTQRAEPGTTAMGGTPAP